MVRNIFRTVFIGMMAVAGLMLLFFILKVILFFLVAGFIARMAMKYFMNKRMGHYQAAWATAGNRSPFQPAAEPLFGNAWKTPNPTGFGYSNYGQSSAIVEITR